MARTTAGRLAEKTAAAARKVTAGVAKRAGAATQVPAQAGSASPRKAATKKTPAQKTPAKKAAAKKAAATKAPVNAAAKAAVVKKTAAKQAVAERTPAKKAPAKKTAAKKTAAKKTAAKQTPAKKTAAKQAAPAKKTLTKKTAATRKATLPTPRKKSAALTVKSDESPWTAQELQEVRAELLGDVERLRGELDLAERELDDLMRDAGDGAGHDQADVGSTTFERDHEVTLANNARDMLLQSMHALERIDDGTYGVCESCGEAVGKNRLMAFPRATLCLSCKQREERR